MPLHGELEVSTVQLESWTTWWERMANPAYGAEFTVDSSSGIEVESEGYEWPGGRR